MKAILLDIEGTTTPIDFVKDLLFPFAKKKFGGFVRENFGTLQAEIAALSDEHRKDRCHRLYDLEFDDTSPESVTQYLHFLIDHDRKLTALKSLQGEVWKSGYESGELRSIVYEDVARAFTRWKAAGDYVAIYSSGSVEAQKLLFKYSDRGDLTAFISGYFDTRTGAKRESASYRQIAATGFPQVEKALFVSDIVAELDAARAAGFETMLAVREGNARVDEKKCGHRIIRSFDEID